MATLAASLVGQRAMVGSGLDLRAGQLNVKPRTCALCRGNSMTVEHDGALNRIIGCDDCGALHVASKARPVPNVPGAFYAGWDHGTKLPHEWPAAFLARMRSDAA